MSDDYTDYATAGANDYNAGQLSSVAHIDSSIIPTHTSQDTPSDNAQSIYGSIAQQPTQSPTIAPAASSPSSGNSLTKDAESAGSKAESVLGTIAKGLGAAEIGTVIGGKLAEMTNEKGAQHDNSLSGTLEGSPIIAGGDVSLPKK